MPRERRANPMAARDCPVGAVGLAAALSSVRAERDACIHAHSPTWLAAGGHHCNTREIQHVSRPEYFVIERGLWGAFRRAVAQAMRCAGCLNRRSLGVSDVFPLAETTAAGPRWCSS